jgi:demethylmenaquinone methyltransferase/2-methoxy-6-polyprenyl-1,4-benzoquinol methylase
MQTDKKTWSSEVQQMFSQIALRYDLMNRLMTINKDKYWRKEVIKLAQLPPTGSLLDLGTGTGKLALEALYQHPNAYIVAGDFTLEMMKMGKRADKASNILWCTADTLQIPFPDNSFDAVVSGFLLRNVKKLDDCLKEQYRVLKSGGKLVTLDTTRPTPHLFSPLVNYYLIHIIPCMGQVIAGNINAYHYLPSSTINFLTAELLADKIISTGFHQVVFRRFMYGTIAIHWGVK